MSFLQETVIFCKNVRNPIDLLMFQEVLSNNCLQYTVFSVTLFIDYFCLFVYFQANTFYCLVLECASGGDLQAYIKSYKDCFLPEEKARPYLRQLVSAVHYLHERGVSHR